MTGSTRLFGTLLVWVAGAWTPVGAELKPVERPSTAGMEPAVQAQFEAVASALDRAFGTAGATERERLDAFAECGLVYAAYGQLGAAADCFGNAEQLAPDDPRWPYYLGVLHQDGGEFDAAIVAFERARELRAGDPAILLRLGEVLFRAGDLERAEAIFREALPVLGAIAGAHYGLGRIAADRERLDEAIAHFEAALARQPGASIVHYALGQALRRAGRRAEARRELAAHGDSEVRFPDRWMADLGSRNRGSQQLVGLGTEALTQRRFDVAIEAFERALASHPEDSSTWTKLGVAHERLGELEAAERCYREAIATGPENARARYDLGTLLAKTGRLREGLVHLEEAARLSPDSPSIAFNLARGLAESGDHSRALEILDRLLQRAPSDLEARFARALSLAALGRYDQAAAELATVVAGVPAQVAPRLAEARALLNAGRAGEARGRLLAAHQRFPDDAEVAFLLLRVLTTAEDPAIRDGAQAGELLVRLAGLGNAAHEEAQALGLAALGRASEALAHAERAVELSAPEDPAGDRRRRCLERLRRNQPCRTAPGDW